MLFFVFATRSLLCPLVIKRNWEKRKEQLGGDEGSWGSTHLCILDNSHLLLTLGNQRAQTCIHTGSSRNEQGSSNPVHLTRGCHTHPGRQAARSSEFV